MLNKNLLLVKSRLLQRASSLSQRLQLPEKWKGGLIEKWSFFFKGVMLDYQSVASDVIQDSKSRPLKALAIASGLGTLWIAMKTNPDENSFHDMLVHCTSSLIMVGEPIRNPVSENYVKFVTTCENQGLLRRTNLIFCTLMWVADEDKSCAIYSTQCQYLKPKILTFYERVIDVGLFGMWLNFRLKMLNFDINPKEWKDNL